MRALERGFGRQAGKLSHQPHEMNARHLGDKRIALRHVADQRSYLIRVVADVVAKDVRRSELVEREIRAACESEWSCRRRLGPSRPIARPRNSPRRFFENRSAAKLDAQPVKIDDWGFSQSKRY